MNDKNNNRLTVLYAEDDKDDIILVSEAFKESTENIELVTAENGMDAINYLERLSPMHPEPCLIILDINMPKLNGRETLVRIRQMERFKSTPVVLFTTSSMPLDRSFAEKYNAGFITKPLNSHQMRVISNTFLDHCTEDVRKMLSRRN
jgi:CheY-like chemotaxis protein